MYSGGMRLELGYLTGGLILGVVYLVLYLWRKDLRREMLFGGLMAVGAAMSTGAGCWQGITRSWRKGPAIDGRKLWPDKSAGGMPISRFGWVQSHPR